MNSYLKKRGQFSILGKILMVVVVSLVLLLFSTNLFGIIKDMSAKSACQASAIASAVTNVATMGSDVVKLDCPTTYVSIQKNDKKIKITEDIPLKIINVDKFFGSGEIARLNSQAVNYFQGKKVPDGISLEEKYAFRLNEAVAKEMKDCWDNMGQGKLNLFTAWFDYYSTRTDSDASWLKQNLPSKTQAPTICVICSRIVIEEELYEQIADELIKTSSIDDFKSKPNSLIYWLTHNPVPKTSMSYYEYLLDDVSNDIFGPENRNYIYTNEPMAVVFARTNIHALDQLKLTAPKTATALAGLFLGGPIGSVLTLIGAGSTATDTMSKIATAKDSMSAVYLVPYDELNQLCSTTAN